MSRKRIIGIITIKDGIVVQSIGFNTYLPIGSLNIAIEYFNDWELDEIAIIDISASKGYADSFYGIDLKSALKLSSIPVSIGGGIKSYDQAAKLIDLGCEKIIVNSILFSDENFISSFANSYGSQAIIAAIDIHKNSIYSNSATNKQSISLQNHINYLDSLPIGEILINSIDRDGLKIGYDIKLINEIETFTSKPIISLGGAGKMEDFLTLFKQTNASAAAAGNMLHFTEHSAMTIKGYLRNNKVNTRKEITFIYNDTKFIDNKIYKKTDKNEIL